MIIAFNKPYGMVAEAGAGGASNPGLAACHLPPGLRLASGLAPDSEGLLLLTDEPQIHGQLLEVLVKSPCVFWVQVERIPTEAVLQRLQRSATLPQQSATPSRVWLLAMDPDVQPLEMEESGRRIVPTGWLSCSVVGITDRQLRKLTAAVGHPAVRIMQLQIGAFALGELPPGQWRELSATERSQLVGQPNALGSPWRYRKPHTEPRRP